jgi:hypothetical protein
VRGRAEPASDYAEQTLKIMFFQAGLLRYGRAGNPAGSGTGYQPPSASRRPSTSSIKNFPGTHRIHARRAPLLPKGVMLRFAPGIATFRWALRRGCGCLGAAFRPRTQTGGLVTRGSSRFAHVDWMPGHQRSPNNAFIVRHQRTQTHASMSPRCLTPQVKVACRFWWDRAAYAGMRETAWG